MESKAVDYKRLLKNFSSVSLGTLISQFVAIASIPVIAYYYMPEELGKFSVVFSVVSIFTPFFCLRYEQSIMLPKEDGDANSLIRSCLLIGLCTTVSLMAVIHLLEPQFVGLFKLQGIWNPGVLIPVLVFINGLSLLMPIVVGRLEKFRSIATGRILRSSVIMLTQVICGAMAMGVAGLLMGIAIGITAEILFLNGRGRVTGVFFKEKKPSSQDKGLLRNYWKFPMYSLPSGILVSIGSYGMPLVIAAVFSPHVAGLFWVAEKCLNIPITLISQSLGVVLYQRLCQMRAEQADLCADLLAKVFAVLLVATVVISTAIVLLAPSLINFFFGEKWADVGTMIMLMTPRAAMIFCALPLTQAFTAFEKQEVLTLSQFVFVLGPMGVVVVVAGYISSETELIFMFSCMYFVSYLFIAMLAIRTAGVSFFEALLLVMRNLLHIGTAVRTLVSKIGRNA